jgi:DNA-binding GntR family transcriptional regulator
MLVSIQTCIIELVGYLRKLKKQLRLKNGSSILEIDEVHFITDKTIGAYDNHQYQYNIKSLIK